MDAFRRALQTAKTTAAKLSNEIVPKLNDAAEVDDAKEESLAALSSIRSAIRSLPDEVRSDRETETARAAVVRATEMLTSLLGSARLEGGVPQQDLTFRDKASEVKAALATLEEKAEAADARVEGGRRRRKSRKGKKSRASRASRKGKTRATRRR